MEVGHQLPAAVISARGHTPIPRHKKGGVEVQGCGLRQLPKGTPPLRLTFRGTMRYW
jgi:hypothetical protein